MNADERGLTTVEVLVAAGILSMGLVALLAVVPISIYGLHEGGHLSAATFLAEQKLEEVRSAPWSATPAVDCLGLSVGDASPTSTGCSRPPAACDTGSGCDRWPDEKRIAGQAGYERRVRIADCATVPGGCGGVLSSTLRRATVTVTYQPLTGAAAAPGTAKPVVLVMDIARR